MSCPKPVRLIALPINLGLTLYSESLVINPPEETAFIKNILVTFSEIPAWASQRFNYSDTSANRRYLDAGWISWRYLDGYSSLERPLQFGKTSIPFDQDAAGIKLWLAQGYTADLYAEFFKYIELDESP